MEAEVQEEEVQEVMEAEAVKGVELVVDMAVVWEVD